MRTYWVDDIDFDVTPTTQKFVYNNEELSVAEYFHQVYGKAITDMNQPLIVVKHGDG